MSTVDTMGWGSTTQLRQSLNESASIALNLSLPRSIQLFIHELNSISLVLLYNPTQNGILSPRICKTHVNVYPQCSMHIVIPIQHPAKTAVADHHVILWNQYTYLCHRLCTCSRRRSVHRCVQCVRCKVNSNENLIYFYHQELCEASAAAAQWLLHLWRALFLRIALLSRRDFFNFAQFKETTIFSILLISFLFPFHYPDGEPINVHCIFRSVSHAVINGTVALHVLNSPGDKDLKKSEN